MVDFKKRLITSGPFKGLLRNHYKVILCDPPWAFKIRSAKGGGRSAEKHYNTLSLDDIAALPVKELCAKDCVIFMWITDPMLFKGIDMMRAWGFEYKTVGFYWVKLNQDGKTPFTGMGFWTRCLSGKTMVHVQNKASGEIRHLSLSELSRLAGNKGELPALEVWTHKGWRKINHLYKNGKREIVEMVTRSGSVFSTGDHRWGIKRLRTTRKAGDVGRNRITSLEYATTKWITSKKLKASEHQGSTNLLFSAESIQSRFPKIGVCGFSLTEELGWVLGLYCAEGHRTKEGNRSQVRFSVHEKEVWMVEKVQALLDDLDLRNERYFNERMVVGVHKSATIDSKGIAFYFSSKKFGKLIDEIVPGDSAHTKRLNNDLLLHTPVAFRKGFLRGMLDGDGVKVYNPGGINYEGYIKIGLCNAGLIDDLIYLCHGLGLPTKKLNPVTCTTGKSAAVPGGTKNYGFMFAFNRNGKQTFEGGEVQLSTIKGVRYSELEETFDLEVEGHSFVADWHVSHNSNPEQVLTNLDDDSQLLLGATGHPKRQAMNVPKLIMAPRREHSRKPDEIFERIESLVEGPYLELFARQARPNWTTWGNQVERFPAIVDEDDLIG